MFKNTDELKRHITYSKHEMLAKVVMDNLQEPGEYEAFLQQLEEERWDRDEARKESIEAGKVTPVSPHGLPLTMAPFKDEHGNTNLNAFLAAMKRGVQ